MNKVFKVIFSQSLGIFLAVSELAKGKVKSQSKVKPQASSLNKTNQGNQGTTFGLSTLAVAIAATLTPFAGAQLAENTTTYLDMEGNTQHYRSATTYFDYATNTYLGHSDLLIDTVFEGAEYSPHEWQLGINYWWKKAHGDRQEYYPFYKKYKRADDVFLRAMAPNSNLKHSQQWQNYVAEHQASLGDNLSLQQQPTLGHIPLNVPEEPSFTYEIIPNIQERQFKDQDIDLKLNKPQIHNLATESIKISPQEPVTPSLERVTFKPVVPEKVEIEPPVIPKTQEPQSIVFLAYPDCNNQYLNCRSFPPIAADKLKSYIFHGWTDGNGNSGNINLDKTPYFLYGTWKNRPDRGSMSSLVFKMVFPVYFPEKNFGENHKPDNLSKAFLVDSFNLPEKPTDPTEEANFTDNYFYNNKYAKTQEAFDKKEKKQRWRDELNLTDALQKGGASDDFYNKILNRNRQYFLIGGSRGLEADDEYYMHWLADHSLKLAGPLVIGMAKQDTTNTNGIKNFGEINDADENTLEKIKNMPTDAGQDYLTLVGPRKPQYLNETNVCSDASAAECLDEYTTFKIQKSADGYVGRKVGMMALEEDNDDVKGLVENHGKIDLRGASSIGMYVYIPKNKAVGDKNYHLEFENKEGGSITLSGANSYGMKWSAQSNSRIDSPKENTFVNAGNISLRKNPGNQADGTTPGVDKADGSVGMGLLVDPTLYTKHTSLKKILPKIAAQFLLKIM